MTCMRVTQIHGKSLQLYTVNAGEVLIGCDRSVIHARIDMSELLSNSGSGHKILDWTVISWKFKEARDKLKDLMERASSFIENGCIGWPSLHWNFIKAFILGKPFVSGESEETPLQRLYRKISSNLSSHWDEPSKRTYTPSDKAVQELARFQRRCWLVNMYLFISSRCNSPSKAALRADLVKTAFAIASWRLLMAFSISHSFDST